MLTPEINTVNTQLPVSKIDWPKSGWSTKRIITEHKIKKLKKYFTWEFCNFFKVKILTVINIKNGFNISIGCNLKKNKSNQRFAPFTSTPIIGTRASDKKDTTNNGIINFFNNEVLIAEIETIISNAKIVKLRCFEKKSSNLYLAVHQLEMMWKKMKKINQEKKEEESLIVFSFQYFSNNLIV